MTFTTVAEAYNAYRGKTVEQLEARAQELKAMIETDPQVDIKSMNIELTALKEAKEDAETEEARSQGSPKGFKLVGGINTGAAKTFDVETVADTPEYRSAFFKNMLGQKMDAVEEKAFECGLKLAEKRSDAYSTSSEVAAILPTETLNEVVSKAHKMGGLIAECRAFTVPTKISIPVGTPSTKAAWHTEGAAVDTEEPSIVAVSFDGYEILKIFSISAKVRKMSIAAFEAYLIEELTACVMETISDALVNGTGSAQGSGLETISWTTSGTTQNAVEVANTDDIEYTDVVNLIALLKRGYTAGAKIAMNNSTLYKSFYGMVDTNNRPILLIDPKSESIGKVFGFEVIVDDNIADNVVYFGNFAKYLGYNIPEGIAVEVSTQSGFRKGLVDYRALCIADCKPIVSDAFVKLYKAA